MVAVVADGQTIYIPGTAAEYRVNYDSGAHMSAYVREDGTEVHLKHSRVSAFWDIAPLVTFQRPKRSGAGDDHARR